MNVTRKLAQRSERALARNFWREQAIARHLRPHLRTSTDVLDLGAGSCKLAQYLTEHQRHRVTALDIVDHNVTPLPLQLYSGGRLPFADGYFDTVLLAFVLHHAMHAEQLLREAVRVTRTKVILVEDAPASCLQRRAWQAWDYMLNHGTHEDVHIAQVPPTCDGWFRYLGELGLSPTYSQTFRTPFPVAAMFRHALFVIEKCD